MGNLKIAPVESKSTICEHKPTGLKHHISLYSVSNSGVFPTNKDSAADTEAESHTEGSSLVSSLQRGNHVLEFVLKLKGVDQPLILKTDERVDYSQLKTQFDNKKHHYVTVCYF